MTLLPVVNVAAGRRAKEVKIEDTKLTRNASVMNVSMRMNLSGLKVGSPKAVVFVPVIVNGGQSLELPSIGIYGRDRWYQSVRAGSRPLGGADETSYRYSKRPRVKEYSRDVPYESWMNDAVLVVRRLDYGCKNCKRGVVQSDILAVYSEARYKPEFIFVSAAAEDVKIREIAGRAYIDFPANSTELYADYRNNPAELAKIVATIDSVRNDRDVTVRRLTIKGWASPESMWDNNTRLAKGRTETLKRYVQDLYHFPEWLIETDYCPEDWEGLREFIEASNLPHRREMLAIIDDKRFAPDPREWKLKSTYPEEYKYLRETVYPRLRRSDYAIEYTIRQYGDPAEIRGIMATAPQKLSLNEFFFLARSLEPGSDEYSEVFETAVRLYPDDAAANLNAANAAMQRGDLERAGRYLAKAGTGAEAEYARGVLSALRGDYATAVEYVGRAGAMGLSGCGAVIESMMEAAKYRD